MSEKNSVWTPQMRQTAKTVAASRPDLAATDAIAAVLGAEPWLSAEEVIEILDEATEEWSREKDSAKCGNS